MMDDVDIKFLFERRKKQELGGVSDARVRVKSPFKSARPRTPTRNQQSSGQSNRVRSPQFGLAQKRGMYAENCVDMDDMFNAHHQSSEKEKVALKENSRAHYEKVIYQKFGKVNQGKRIPTGIASNQEDDVLGKRNINFDSDAK